MQVRTPAVAGTFYSDDRAQLISQIRDSFSGPFGPGSAAPLSDSERVFGVISPHAGYAYSGQVAAQSYHAISSQEHKLAIIIGPNHRGTGADVATSGECMWQTPLGDVVVDSEATGFAGMHDILDTSFDSHAQDHSLEVQVPMLRFVFPQIRILPIIMKRQDIETAISLGDAVARIVQKTGAIIVGSSDFTHYVPNQHAHRQDMELLDALCSMDVERFYDALERLCASVCGYGAIAAVMSSCRILGATRGVLLQYATSGDITGDKDSVVGYGSVAFC